jgi:hypothetical protein
MSGTEGDSEKESEAEKEPEADDESDAGEESEAEEAEASEPEKAKAEAVAKKITIGKHDFWCEPSNEDAFHDPTKGRGYTDPDGNYYWCIPLSEYVKQFGRRYDSNGPIPPYPIPGID